MLTKLIVPVIDTEYGKFEYKGRELSRNEYGDMEYEHFMRTNKQVSRFVDNMRNGISNVNPYGNRMQDVNDFHDVDIRYNDEEIQVRVSDSKRNDMEEETLLSNAKSGKMFILIFDINPNTLSGDAESEIRFWMDDSMKVIRDQRLPDDTKLKTLPGRDFGIVVGDSVVRIMNCKMVQNFSVKSHPYNFAIIVEKANIE